MRLEFSLNRVLDVTYRYYRLIKLPAPQLTRFKKDFADDMKSLFENLVETTAPICKEIDPKKSEYLIFDAMGIEPFVAEKPKFLNTKLKSAKSIAKSSPDFNVYKSVYSMLPDEAKSAPETKHQYITMRLINFRCKCRQTSP